MTVRFDGRVAIITGAGNGLGRSHALGLAARGAKVVVNDLGSAVDGNDGSRDAADLVVEEIRSLGGEAMASSANVADYAQVQAMVSKARKKWGRVDILVNNAGILRDKSFSKMDVEDFKAVVDVHLMGSANCTRAVWETMREQQYGRIVMTSSSSGLYGNFGQANYGAAKMGVVGLMNALHLEGARYGIHINTLSPTAATRMTEDLVPRACLDLMTVESVTAGLLYLVQDQAPSRLILCAGAGGYAVTRIYETNGIYLAPDEQTPENIASNLSKLLDSRDQAMLQDAQGQTMKFVTQAAKALGVTLEGTGA
ncbi:SDR family NAD(P)-dependent oxidoreductase [Halomonas eurihalina]|uniref:SDR family NAD(P)-dependent oxidoreductase n=1 Tax=Halomonas eurihalina TaxID=42566 RepID=A0A5D9DAV0_HALER|nr:SDR family NAD(P)-dependent oxidoreductase [Halomonas eurihalina]MDR5859252.1 SDR family NAD(P)-dependent oxidoreductase [Halomonas eurihalina]TZG40926.1 SDR family NAD(P)-dependent oxidoreductase [Halomonas eurihalina]